MARRLKELRRRATAWVALPAICGVSLLPRPVVCRMGAFLGGLAFRVAKAEREKAEGHLRYAFGDEFSAAERRKIVHDMFCHFGAIAGDVLVMHRLGAAKVRARIPIQGWEEAARVYDGVLAEGNGLIGLTAHFGNWELFGCLGSLQWPGRAVCVGRRNSSPGYQRIMERIRGRLGVTMLYQDENARGAVRVLKENGLLGVLPDQDAKHVHGVFVDFFGHSAHTPSAPAKMCWRLGSPIVPLFILREGNGYRVIVREPIRREHASGSADPVQDLTSRWTRVVEEEIRRCPSQWVWVHKRWNTTPEVLERRRKAKAASS